MWSDLMHRLSRRNGRLTWFGRWYLGHPIGTCPGMVDDMFCPGCGAAKGAWRGATWHDTNCPHEMTYDLTQRPIIKHTQQRR